MRALCGSIIAAGAMIGLGLTALGFGVRYQGWYLTNPKANDVYYGATSMGICMVVLLIGALIGLAIAFIGLAYHHERRHRERLHYDTMGTAGTARIP
jgi:predicted histidine transporter YuiF (NhaC family)